MCRSQGHNGGTSRAPAGFDTHIQEVPGLEPAKLELISLHVSHSKLNSILLFY